MWPALTLGRRSRSSSESEESVESVGYRRYAIVLVLVKLVVVGGAWAWGAEVILRDVSVPVEAWNFEFPGLHRSRA